MPRHRGKLRHWRGDRAPSSAQGAKVLATARRVDKIERLEGVTAMAADVTRSDDLERVAALGPVEIR